MATKKTKQEVTTVKTFSQEEMIALYTEKGASVLIEMIDEQLKSLSQDQEVEAVFRDQEISQIDTIEELIEMYSIVNNGYFEKIESARAYLSTVAGMRLESPEPSTKEQVLQALEARVKILTHSKKIDSLNQMKELAKSLITEEERKARERQDVLDKMAKLTSLLNVQ